MFLIIRGEIQLPIGYDEIFLKCQACEGDTFSEVTVLSKYYHLYYVPMLPIAKEVNIQCTECGMRRFSVPLDKDIIPNYEEINDKFRHPWFTYIGVAIGVICVLAIITEFSYYE